jgi:hypothetical protein
LGARLGNDVPKRDTKKTRPQTLDPALFRDRFGNTARDALKIIRSGKMQLAAMVTCGSEELLPRTLP